MWHSINCWNHKQGMIIHCHAKTLDVAKREAEHLRRYKITGRNGPTRKNYYGRVTIRKSPNDQAHRQTGAQTNNGETDS